MPEPSGFYGRSVGSPRLIAEVRSLHAFLDQAKETASADHARLNGRLSSINAEQSISS